MTPGEVVEDTPSPPRTPVRQRVASRVELAARYATAGQRPLPDFVIIGAQRSGTTSLYRWLTDRPDVGRAWRKEVHFFDNHYERGLRWYKAHFPLRRAGRITGESTPYLLLHPLAPDRAAKDLPDACFIALLRDPVERAISNHWLRRRLGAARDESLEQALDREAESLSDNTDKLVRGEVSLAHMAYSYVARGEYAPQLRRWFDAAGRDRVLVVESERLASDPRVAAGVLERLGLPDRGDPFPVTNQVVRGEEVSEATMTRLRAHFEPHNRELFELLGYELWTDQPAGPPAGSS
jgi:Sulfotransferase domain